MTFVNASIIQMDIEHGRPELNMKKAELLISKAAISKPDVILLPEMWTTGYDLEHIGDICDNDGLPTIPLLQELAVKYNTYLVGGSIANKENGKLYNTGFVIDKAGKVISKYNKIHLFKLMREDKYISGGSEACMFELSGIKCGLIICYDLRFPELIRKLSLMGIKVLFVPAEWPAARLQHWITLLAARAIENQIFVVAANRAGSLKCDEFAGGSVALNPWGDIIAKAGGEEEILNSKLDLSIIDTIKSKINILEDRVPEAY